MPSVTNRSGSFYKLLRMCSASSALCGMNALLESGFIFFVLLGGCAIQG
jgi:hypothetical protein